ncbi:MAG: thermonuclease family protein, partial [Actinomycetales bacterium]
VQASQFATERLDGAEVVLEQDPSQQPKDRYGRTLAYVWLVDDAGRARSLFNLEAVGVGAAREATYVGAYQWQQAFRAAERSARQQGLGLWGACDIG